MAPGYIQERKVKGDRSLCAHRCDILILGAILLAGVGGLKNTCQPFTRASLCGDRPGIENAKSRVWTGVLLPVSRMVVRRSTMSAYYETDSSTRVLFTSRIAIVANRGGVIERVPGGASLILKEEWGFDGDVASGLDARGNSAPFWISNPVP